MNRPSVWGKGEKSQGEERFFLQALALSLPSPRDFFTISPNREPVHRLYHLKNYGDLRGCYLLSHLGQNVALET